MNRITFGALSSLVVLATACGGDDAAPAADDSNAKFSTALTTVKSTLEEVAALNPDAAATMSKVRRKSLASVSPMASIGASAWDSGTVRMPDQSGDDVSIKEYMGKQLDPEAVGTGDGGDFQLNVFGRFNNSMMIGCALMQLAPSLDATTGYPENGSMSITLTAENAAVLVEKCGMSQTEADGMASLSPTISATVASATDTTYYDKKITMTLPDEMGGATQYFYFRFNDEEINILNAEDGDFDSRTMVNLDLATNILKVEYYSGGTSDDAALYFHRLYYDKDSDIGKIATYYGNGSDYVQYTLVGKPTAGGTFALSFKSDQAVDYDGQACIGVAEGTLDTDDSLACTLTGTAVASATVLSDAFGRLGDADWVEPSETKANTFTVDTIFTAASP